MGPISSSRFLIEAGPATDRQDPDLCRFPTSFYGLPRIGRPDVGSRFRYVLRIRESCRGPFAPEDLAASGAVDFPIDTL